MSEGRGRGAKPPFDSLEGAQNSSPVWVLVLCGDFSEELNKILLLTNHDNNYFQVSFLKQVEGFI